MKIPAVGQRIIAPRMVQPTNPFLAPRRMAGVVTNVWQDDDGSWLIFYQPDEERFHWRAYRIEVDGLIG